MGKYLAILSLCLPLAGLAQDFSLFDPYRGKPPVQEKPAELPPPAPPPAPPAPPKKQEDFMLLGTQLIGSRKIAYLQAPDGKNIRQVLNPKSASPITGYKGYYLREVGGREVKIAYPAEAPCQENRDEKGVRCENENLAVLSLKRGKPTPPTQPLMPAVPEIVPTLVPPQVPGGSPPDGSQAQAFQPKIISDQEIPPGMKRIRTPFGDRLVPAQ